MSEAITTTNESSDTERLSSNSQVSGHRHALVAFGDSFVGPLTLLKHRRVYVKKFSGASAKGLSNKNSLSQTGVLVAQLLDSHKPEQILLVFGHVDLHILYLWKALKAQLDNSDPPTPQGWSVAVLNSYVAFIRDDILPRRLVDNTGYLRKIFVASVIMPCVDDEHLDESVRKYQRREEDAVLTRDLRLVDSKVPTDLETRRVMVRQFNSSLSTFCNEHDVRFVDINKHITTDAGEVKPNIIDHDPTTVHVQWESTIGFWVEELADAGLVKSDIREDIDATATQYEAEKKDRMQRRRLAADATLSPTLSDFSIEDPGSPLILPQRSMNGWMRGRSSTPPPGSHVRSTQTSPESGPSWRGRVALGRGRGTGSPPRANRSSGFRFGASTPSKSRPEDDDNWRIRSVVRRNSVPHVTSRGGPEGVFQSNNSSPIRTPLQSPLFGEFAPPAEPATQGDDPTQEPEGSEGAN
ncbi:hypothetical protein BDV93DRAFT_601914 [Ceratobasidium sp. AG-I]|nr:hypothetical protein BDV93DRAFT_601914 [Ceratobasidium sp. AG-I]